MTPRALFPIIAASVWLAACSEGVGPPPGSDLDASDRSLHHLRWSPALGAPTFAASRDEFSAEGPRAASGPAGALILDTYQTSFWAHRGTSAGVEIHYRAADGTWRPYVRLTVPKDALDRRPDGSRIANRDSVLITVAVDTTLLMVRFEPTGLVFNDEAPALLEFRYTGADPDLDGNGTVDSTDRYVERELLGVWVQEHPGDPWESVVAVQSLETKLFTASLRHFSGYAVSH